MLSHVRRALSVTTLLALLLVVSPLRAPLANAGSCWSWSGKEKRLARMTNRTRARHGVRTLSLDPELSKVASVHSREMARRRTIYHTPYHTLKKRVTRWKRLGENVGHGGSVARIHRGFMRSYSHRANLLDGGFGHFGIGIRAARGRLWVTVVFATSPNPGTTLKMPC